MRASPKWIASLLATLSVSFATLLAPEAQQRGEQRGSDNFLKMMLGDGRRLFANHFFTKADEYFHSGFYPSVFDQANQEAPKAITQTTHDDHDGHDKHQHDEQGHCIVEGHEEEGMDFQKPPRDWIEHFGRNFVITEHTHLKAGQEKEMLPWLKLAAEMDPQMVQAYITTAYWLRREKDKSSEALEFLRDGFKKNPGSYEILFEMGRIYFQDMQETNRARNLWVQALRRWNEQPSEAKTNSMALEQCREIVVNLGKLEDSSGNYEKAIKYLEMGKLLSPNPEALQKQIDDISQKMKRN